MDTLRLSAVILLLALPITGCTVVGIGVGATVGGVVGSMVGTGSGVSIVGGALVGGFIGSGVGEPPREASSTQAK